MIEGKVSNLIEKEKKIIVTAEDITNIRNFYTQFEIPISEDLEQAIRAFTGDGSFENQAAIRLALCKSIIGTKHEAFEDAMMKEARAEAEAIAYKAEFDKELEETLTVDNKPT